MLKRWFLSLLLCLFLCEAAAAANTTLGNLTAGGSVAGTDLFYDVQTVGTGGVKVTGTQLSTFIWGAGGATVASSKATFGNTALLVLGTSTGATTLSSANASASAFTATLPANTGTIAELNLAQTFSAQQTFSSTLVFSGLSPGTQTKCLGLDVSNNVVTNAAACGSGGGGTPGGANTDVQFNSSGSFGGDAGFVYAGNGQATLALGTITTNLKALNITGTWNASGVTFDAPLFMNITNTASAAGSLLYDFQVGGSGVTGYQIGGTYHSVAVPSSGALVVANTAGTAGFSIAPGGGGFGVEFQSGSTYTFDAQIVVNAAILFGAGNQTRTLNLAQITTSSLGLTTTAATATTFQVYNSIDSGFINGASPTNYERATIDWITTTNTLRFGTENGGTGSVRNMEFVIGGTNKMDYGVTTAGTWTLQGNVNAPGLASLSAATTAWVCWTTATGALSEDSASCITSLRRYKNDIAPFSEATVELMSLKPSTFTWKKPLDRNQQGLQLGFIAEDVEQVDPKLASYSHDGTLHGWQEESMIALLVRGFQEQQAEIEQLKRRAAR